MITTRRLGVSVVASLLVFACGCGSTNAPPPTAPVTNDAVTSPAVGKAKTSPNRGGKEPFTVTD